MQRQYSVIVAIVMGYVVLSAGIGRSEAKLGMMAPELIKRARSGPVRVIVNLDPVTTPEGFLPRTMALRQRKAIAAAQAAVETALVNTPYRIIRRFETIPSLAVEVDAGGLAALAKSRRVLRVEADRLNSPLLTQSVPLVEADQARTYDLDGNGWVVAVLDTGVDAKHPFLSGAVIEEACYASGGNCPNGRTTQIGVGAAIPCTYDSGCSHGSHVSGIIVGHSATISGVAPRSHLIAVQVFSNVGGRAGAYTSDLLAGLERVYALRNTYQIAAVNMSLGGSAYNSTSACDADNGAMKSAIDNLRSVGIASVIAAGNSSYTNALSFPACISTSVSVGATTKSDTISWFSNSVAFISILAPGEGLSSCVPGGGFLALSGTSMAAPHVAGAWALYKQADPTAGVTTILQAFQTAGLPLTDPRNNVTKGRIRIARALPKPTVPAPFGVTSPTPGTVVFQWGDTATTNSYVEVLEHGEVIMIVVGPNVTTATLRNLDPGASNHYQLRACNSIFCSESTEIVGKTADGSDAPPPPAAPSNLVVDSPLPGTVVLSWVDNSSTETRFEVLEYVRHGGVAVTVGANVTTATISGLDPGVSFHWDLRACNAVGCSPRTGIVGKTPNGE